MSEGDKSDNLLPPRTERFGWALPDLKYLEITRDDDEGDKPDEGEESPDGEQGEE